MISWEMGSEARAERIDFECGGSTPLWTRGLTSASEGRARFPQRAGFATLRDGGLGIVRPTSEAGCRASPSKAVSSHRTQHFWTAKAVRNLNLRSFARIDEIAPFVQVFP